MKQLKIRGLILCIVCFYSTINAQESKFQLGIITGNHFSFSSYEKNLGLKGNPLLRYSAGILARYKLKSGYKRKALYWMPPTKDGVFALDIGANVVFTGYDYQVNAVTISKTFQTNTHQLSTYEEQMMVEFPILLVFWDNRSVLLKRKLQRQGIAFFSRVGVKPSVLFSDNIEKQLETDHIILQELTSFGGFNLFGMFSMGLMKNFKNANSASVEISGNLGIFTTTKGQVTHKNLNTHIQNTQPFSSNGHYLAVKVMYLFKSDIYHRVTPRIIYNPRFN